MDVEVLGEERGTDHADALLHPSSAPKLPHASIYEWEPGTAFLPSL